MSLVPTIGSIGWATLKTVRAPAAGRARAGRAAGAAGEARRRPPTALADNTFLRSIRLSPCLGLTGVAGAVLHWHHDLALLVLRLFCVLAPLGGWRGDRVGKDSANRTPEPPGSPGGFLLAKGKARHGEEQQQRRGCVCPRRTHQPDRRPADQGRDALAAAGAPDPVLPDRRHAGRAADRRDPRRDPPRSCSARTTGCW